MSAETKLKLIAKIYESERPMADNAGMATDHIRLNLEGALYDMERTGKADAACINTVKRAIDQLAKIENVLGI